MLYKKYSLKDNKIELMLPSDFERVDQYAWCSKSQTVRVDFSMRDGLKQEQSTSIRLQEHYLFYKNHMEGFACRHIIKKQIWGREFGEMMYSSKQLGYGFFHVLLIGELEGEEILLSLQCLEKEKTEMEQVFSVITDSVRMNPRTGTKEEKYAN